MEPGLKWWLSRKTCSRVISVVSGGLADVEWIALHVTTMMPSKRRRRERYRAHAKRVDCYAFINTKQRMAGLYRGTKLVAAFPITHGRAQFVPRGDWKIQTMLTTPSFRWDERMLKEGQRSESFHLLPPGPNNPVGILWAGINKPGIGLHGTNSPETIGRAYSAGCIRFANWDAIRLPKFLCPGSAVIVR